MNERGRMRVSVIWDMIFRHDVMIFMDSVNTPNRPRNCMSSCSLSMLADFGFRISQGSECEMMSLLIRNDLICELTWKFNWDYWSIFLIFNYEPCPRLYPS